jgi:hypothetical protein
MSAKKKTKTATNKKRISTKKASPSASVSKPELIQKCKHNLVAKNPNISQGTVESICSAMNNILLTQNRDHIPEIFESILHLWFKNISIIEEIFKTIKSKDLCFLHTLRYSFEDKEWTISKHIGRNEAAQEKFDFQKYYNDEIKGCQSNLIAIPLTYLKILGFGDDAAHATMIIVEKGSIQQNGKQLIEVEHFDSSNISGNEIKEPIENLIKSLFGEDKYVFRFHHNDEVCNSRMQARVFSANQKYQGSCTHFAVWYAFKRLLEPEKKREQVIREMDELFVGKDSDEVMIGLVHTFQTLLKINIKVSDDNIEFKVNDRNAPIRNTVKKHFLFSKIKEFKEARKICRNKCLENNVEKHKLLSEIKTDKEFEEVCTEKGQSEDVINNCNNAKTLREKVESMFAKQKKNKDHEIVFEKIDFDDLIDRNRVPFGATFGTYGTFKWGGKKRKTMRKKQAHVW